jgi:hypothetical protein
VMRRHGCFRINVGMAFETCGLFIHRHRLPFAPCDVRVLYVDRVWDVHLWMRVVAIDASHAVPRVCR